MGHLAQCFPNSAMHWKPLEHYRNTNTWALPLRPQSGTALAVGLRNPQGSNAQPGVRTTAPVCTPTVQRGLQAQRREVTLCHTVIGQVKELRTLTSQQRGGFHDFSSPRRLSSNEMLLRAPLYKPHRTRSALAGAGWGLEHCPASSPPLSLGF